MATCIIMQLQIRAGTDHRRGKPTALLIQLRFIQQKNTQNPKKSQRISGDLMPNSRNCDVARDYRCPITSPRHPNLQLRAPTNFLLLLLLLLLSISFLSPNFWLFSLLFQQNFTIAACQTPPSLSLPFGCARRPAFLSNPSQTEKCNQFWYPERTSSHAQYTLMDGWMDGK